MVFIIVFSQYLREFHIPFCSYDREAGCGCTGYPVFQLFPVSFPPSDGVRHGIPGYIQVRQFSLFIYLLVVRVQIILAICVSWAVCAVLTATDAIPDDPDHWAYRGRTDVNNDVIREADWFRFPYPGTCAH